MKKTPVPCALVYRIDANDRISHVNEAWSEFARDNQGESLMPQHVIGQKLFDSTTDITVRELYLQMLRRVRAGTPVRFRYRCDAPDRRRTFEMVIHALTGDTVEFVSTLEHEELRPKVDVLEAGRPRDDRVLRVCSWCQKVALPDKSWVPVERAVDILHLLEALTFPRLTHGICESCRAEWELKNGAID